MRKVDIIAIILLLLTLAFSVGCNVDSPKPQSNSDVSDTISTEKQDDENRVSELFSLTGCNTDDDAAAIKYIGYSIEEDNLKEALSDAAPGFTEYYDDIEYCKLEGDETYLLVPRYKNYNIKIYSVDMDGKRITDEPAFSGSAGAVVFTCNMSDIISNAEVVIEYIDNEGNDCSVSFNPSLSLMDGSICDFENVFEF